MADPLSAVSLLLAAFAVMFGLWYPIATAALAITPGKHRQSRNGQIAQVQGAFWRMMGLLLISMLLFLIFAQRAICIVVGALSRPGTYDDLRTAFVAAESILALLAVLIGISVFRLGGLWRKLDSEAEL